MSPNTRVKKWNVDTATLENPTKTFAGKKRKATARQTATPDPSECHQGQRKKARTNRVLKEETSGNEADDELTAFATPSDTPYSPVSTSATLKEVELDKPVKAEGDEDANEDTVVTDASAYCLLYTSPSPRDGLLSRMPSSA